jgi:hypothetical protein
MFVRQKAETWEIKFFVALLSLLISAMPIFADEQEHQKQPNFIEDFYKTFKPRVKLFAVSRSGTG